MTDALLYAIDWGTSNFRAAAVARDGAVLDRLANAGGLLDIRKGGFEAHLVAALEPWLERFGKLPVMMAGMVGARGGWQEAPYADCPAGAAALAGRLTAVPNGAGLSVHIVPGLACRHDGAPDVMRGEETQVIGYLAGAPDYRGALILPGTHSKLVEVADGTIRGFRTAMTGEIYRTLLAHTILGRTAAPFTGAPSPAFREGLARGLEAGQQLLHALFEVRARALIDAVPEADNGAYLSGLLIGAELQACRPALERQGMPLPVIGAPGIAALYGCGLEVLGLEHLSPAAQDMTVRGLLQIESLRRP